MIRRILRKRRPTPSLTGISTEEELALLRVELMYGLRVNREAYLRRKVDERAEAAARLHGADAADILAGLRDSLERALPRHRAIDRGSRRNVIDLRGRNVVELHGRRQTEDPEPA
ncbi:hypothetical protein [Nonomuraea endophytica]|uniref:Uncharacterized protein n=1 Tax=Nonomuraea endophytica TaxID=714136 RepID=A0A7W8EIT4_9ACTN|nr:hypothetical protein [Nonomuraea endophytica]MBB5080904.1 hypothetical protein [Nonomuraea endophytica]